jgi:hypothetical protein
MSLKDHNNKKNNFGYYNKIIGQTDSNGLFILTGCAIINEDNQFEPRDDFGAYGPVCIDWDERLPYKLPYPLNSNKNIKFMKKIIDFAPYFYVMYIEAQESAINVLRRNFDILPQWQKDAINNGWLPEEKTQSAPEMEDLLISNHPQRHARTLGELFRLIIEWAYVADAPFENQEQPAVLSKFVLEKLNMPIDVRQELLDEYPDMHVAMYLRNDPNALYRPSGIPDITPLFDEWIEQILLKYFNV